MTKNNLKVVKSTKDKELENKEKNKALEAATLLKDVTMDCPSIHGKLKFKFPGILFLKSPFIITSGISFFI